MQADMSNDWFEVSARNLETDLSVAVTAAGMPSRLGDPWILDDGTDVYELIHQDRLEALPFPVVFRPPTAAKGTHRTDMLWTGSSTKIASHAMISALESIGAAGYTTFPIDVRDHQDHPIDGYVGLSVFSTDPGADVRQLFGHDFVFLAKPHVIAALRVDCADALAVSTFDPSDYDPSDYDDGLVDSDGNPLP